MGSSPLTPDEIKKHVQYIRNKRQEQLHATIDECHRFTNSSQRFI